MTSAATAPVRKALAQGEGHDSSRAGGVRGMSRPGWAEILVALICFAVLCGAALSRPVKLLEPDDYAYRASIVALSEGHVVLTDAQYQELRSRLQASDQAAGGGAGGGAGAGKGGGDRRSGSSSTTAAGSARRTPATRSWPSPSSCSASCAPRRCSTARSAASRLFAGGRRWLGAGEARGRSGCSARRAPRSSSPGAPRCRRSPAPRSSPPAPGRCCGRCWPARRARSAGPSSACSASSPSRARCSSATPTSSCSPWPSPPCSSSGASRPAGSRAERSGGGSVGGGSPACSSSPGTSSSTAAPSRPATPRGWSPSASAR